MAVIASDDFAGVGTGSLSSRSLNHALGGAGSFPWVTAGAASLYGDGSNQLVSLANINARNAVDLSSIAPRKARVRLDPQAATSQVCLFAKHNNPSGTGNYVTLLLASSMTSLRVREGVAQTLPAGSDRASLTITAPTVPVWLELEIDGLVATARVLNNDLTVRNTVSHTFTAIPSGGFWGFGMASSGSAGLWDDFIVEDGAAADTLAPTFTGSISVGAKTSSTITLTLPTATDNIAVAGYEYRIDEGTWVNNGLSTSISLTGLSASTSYAIDARAYDAASNRSTTLSVSTSTYREGALGSTLLLTTGPIDGNPAGILYNDVETGDEAKWFSFYIVTDVASGTLSIDPDGTFEFVGPAATSFTYQLEVDGVEVGDPVTVYLYNSGGGGGIIYGETINEKLMSHFGTSGAFADAERSWLISQVGASPLSNNDLWYVFLKTQGYTGSLSDMKSKYFLSILE